MLNELVSVIIITAGKDNYLKYCLNSLLEQVYSNIEIIVIDNSLDSSFTDKISKEYPGIKIYPSPGNLFYSASLNHGIGMSNGAFILCLNDDVALDKNYIKEALRGFDVDPNIGMVSGKLLRFDAKTLDSTGLFLSRRRTATERGYGRIDKGQFDKEGEIFGVCGAAAFYRKQMLQELKLSSEYFDNDFCFFYEDLDMAWRAHNINWKGYYIPKALAFHVRGATAREGKGLNKKYARRYLSEELELFLFRNRYLAIIKNDNYLSFFVNLPFIICYELFLWSYMAIFRPGVIKKFMQSRALFDSALKKRSLLHKKFIQD